MPVIQKTVTVPANNVIENVLQGSAFEFLRRQAVVSMGVTADSTGTFTTIQSGSDIILEETATFIKTQFPIIPDEMFYNDVGVTGDRLVIRMRNSTGTGVVARVIVQLTDL